MRTHSRNSWPLFSEKIAENVMKAFHSYGRFEHVTGYSEVTYLLPRRIQDHRT